MISTHVLDLNLGNPAQGLAVRLEKKSGGTWQAIGEENTNADGRISFNCKPEAGRYRLSFQIERYFAKTGAAAFLQEAVVGFQIEKTDRKYHIPLLLSPFAFSTYRGS